MESIIRNLIVTNTLLSHRRRG